MNETKSDVRHRPVTIITDQPMIAVLGEMKLDHQGVLEMAKWVERYRPECVPAGGFSEVLDLVPHDGQEETRIPLTPPIGPQPTGSIFRTVTDNELLCELAGRKCYDSFAEKGAKRTNAEYLASMWTGRDVVHRSTGYHAKMSFFFAHISRRVSHELIRNYVGADRNEEGNPSQESTRFTEHPGVYIAHPRDVAMGNVEAFRKLAQANYDEYLRYQEVEVTEFAKKNGGAMPKGMDRKRIYESAAGYLLMSCGTSMIWTTNPMALAKFFAERCDEAADLEMARFATALKKVCLARWPGLFPMVR